MVLEVFLYYNMVLICYNLNEQQLNEKYTTNYRVDYQN